MKMKTLLTTGLMMIGFMIFGQVNNANDFLNFSTLMNTESKVLTLQELGWKYETTNQNDYDEVKEDQIFHTNHYKEEFYIISIRDGIELLTKTRYQATDVILPNEKVYNSWLSELKSVGYIFTETDNSEVYFGDNYSIEFKISNKPNGMSYWIVTVVW